MKIFSMGKALLLAASCLATSASQASYELSTTLFGPTAMERDYFGYDIAGAGDRIVVGAPFRDHGASRFTNEGEAYVFQRLADKSWRLESTLRAASPLTNDLFGKIVEINGQVVAVSDHTGEVSIFRRFSNGAWLRQQTIAGRPNNGANPYNRFMALTNKWLVVGNPTASVSSQYRAGNVAVYGLNNSGKFVLSQIIPAPTPFSMQRFGLSVSVSDNDLLVRDANEVHAYRLVNGNWKFSQSLPHPYPGASGAGAAIKVFGNTVLVGQNGFDQQAPGIVYVYQKGFFGQWTPTQELQAFDNGGIADFGFGRALAMDESTLAIGGAHTTQRSYVFTRDSGGLFEPVMPLNTVAGNYHLGNSVALAKNSIVLGGDGYDQFGKPNAGAVFVFEANPVDVPGPVINNFCAIKGSAPNNYTLHMVWASYADIDGYEVEINKKNFYGNEIVKYDVPVSLQDRVTFEVLTKDYPNAWRVRPLRGNAGVWTEWKSAKTCLQAIFD